MADTHLQHVHHTLAVPDGDVLVHAGDALNMGTSLEEVRTFVYWFNNLPHKHKVYVAGNHDWALQPGWNPALRLAALQMLRDAGIVYLQDAPVKVAGLWIYGSPWQPEFGGWAFNLPRNGWELRDRWAAIPEGLDILITHGPPAGIRDCNLGCELLRARVMTVRPRVHVFGHIHGGYGTEQVGNTQFVNAAVCTESYEPINRPHVVSL